MEFRSGKHEGKSFEVVFLKAPSFAHYLSINGQPGIAKEFQKLIKRFDEKPITTPCAKCGNTATRATGYDSGTGLALFFYCDNCDDPWLDEAKGRLIRSFKDAIKFIDDTRNGNKAAKRATIRKLAEAKGLSKKVGEKEALAFFR
jgi:hypothetical protein